MMSKKSVREISESSIVVAVANQISSDLGGESVILNLNSGVYHGLNETGARVWGLIEQPQIVADIKEKLMQEYEIEPEVCMSDLLGLLENLKAVGLIEVR